MLKNAIPLSPEDEPKPDWSHHQIALERLTKARLNAMIKGDYHKARDLWFHIQDVESDLGKAIRWLD